MKAFKVFWKYKIAVDGKPCYSAIVVAGDISQALALAGSYGEVSSVAYESSQVIIAESGPVSVNQAKAAAAVGE